MQNENVAPRTSATAGSGPVRVLVYPDLDTQEELGQDLVKNDSDENKKSPMTLQNVQDSSIHFSTEPQMYVPKVQNSTAVKYGKK